MFEEYDNRNEDGEKIEMYNEVKVNNVGRNLTEDDIN